MKRFHETKEYSFAGLVNTYRRFSIPNFQRSYKWGNKQVTDFFDAIEQNDEGYFIGNIVCVLGNKLNDNRLTIVDGQQRITTITLLLIALRDYATELSLSDSEEESSIDWVNDFLKDRDKKEKKDYYVLHTKKQAFNEVLTDLINSSIKDKYDKAQMVYLKAYRILKSLIAEKVKKDVTKLEELTQKTTELEIVNIVLNSDKEVFNAFDGLNSKGLGLSTSDQVKNHLFSHAATLKCLDEVEQKWNEMETDFNKTNPDIITKFLRHLWISENKYISGKDLYDSIKKEISNNKTPKSLIKYSDKILFYSKFYLGVKYKIFANNLNDLDSNITSTLVNFRFLDNQQIYEILLALYSKCKVDKTFKPKYFRDISIILWNFCLRTKFLTISPSEYERDFANYCEIIKNTKSEDLINKSKTFFDKLRKWTKDREQFVDNINDDLVYDGNSNNNLIEFILRKIIEKEEKNLITLTETSIEHILPQEPKDWGYTKKEIKDFVHNIGNLTLLHPKDNEKAKNKPMKKKCSEIYNNSHFKFNKNISLKYEDIFVLDFKEAIKQRGQDIANQIYDMTRI